MNMLTGVFIVALTASHFGYGLPIGSTPQTYPHDPRLAGDETWGTQSLYAAVPALALLVTAIGFLLGCTWCYRHKDSKPNQGADNQLFTASATHLQDVSRSNPTDSGFSEPANNNISEDNNNGPISLREMQNIANNNAAAYIVSENEERNRVSRESVVEFEPLPTGIRVGGPLERHADWFGGEDFPRNRLQYLREIGRGWFGRVVEGEIEDGGTTTTVAVKILNQNASPEDRARFLEEGRVYRDVRHKNILSFIAKCLAEDPWIMIYELCPMDLQQYLIENRDKMAALNESGVPLRLLCEVTSALAHLHSRGHLYGNVWTGSVLVRGAADLARAVLGQYASEEPPMDVIAPETRRNPALHTASSDVYGVGALAWRVCAWGHEPPASPPPPPPLPCLYRSHLYQVMQLCWHPNPENRPTSAQVHALLNHLHTSNADDEYSSSHFEDRWQRLKPNSIPVIDEHVAIVHAPSTSTASHFTGSDQDFDNPPTIQDSLSVDMDTAVSRSSSIMSDKDPLSVQVKSESLTNLHGSLEDVRNIYLTHNELAVSDCHQGNIGLDDLDKEHDRSDSSMDPWLKDIIAGSQDDVSYFKDVSDVIKNLDNILNSEKTSSSESSHQASPSRDNLSLDCKKDYPIQSCMVKSPGIRNFQNLIESNIDSKSPEHEICEDDDRDTIGTLSHSFERHSDTLSQQTLENITPETPMKDFDVVCNIVCEDENVSNEEICQLGDNISETEKVVPLLEKPDLPKEDKIVSSDSQIPKLIELCVAAKPSVSEGKHDVMNVTQDCKRSCDNNLTDKRTDENETKSIDDVVNNTQIEEITDNKILPKGSVAIENLQVILPKVENENETVVPVIPSLDKVDEDLSLCSGDFEPTAEHGDSSGVTPKVLPISEEEEKNSDLISNIIILQNEIVNSTNVLETLQSSESQAPESVQKHIDSEETDPSQLLETNKTITVLTGQVDILELSPEIVQNENKIKPNEKSFNEDLVDPNKDISKEILNNSTVYMDLINDTNSEIAKEPEPIEENVKEIIKSCLESSNSETNCTLVKNESTVYMDLPSMILETHNFLDSERVASSNNNKVEFKDICSSTPLGSDLSQDETLGSAVKNSEVLVMYERKAPENVVARSEQRNVTEYPSPFESPTKSHPTDTYDENSSVVLGPFENYALDLHSKGGKPCDLVDLPKEELLAFSSNFSDTNLETPSPLRDGRFLNEVPDIVQDDIQFDDIETISEMVNDREPTTESNSNESHSGTEKRISPLTPPNSPGTFLASTSQQHYIVDIDLDPPAGPSHVDLIPFDIDPSSVLHKEIDLNQIELQITSKLAMAENENNLNIEYSGPLSIEGVSGDAILIPDTMPEDSVLAGNGGSLPRNAVELDEECVKALRDELELKLPLAQVANIEPPGPVEWSGSLPPPPELILSYPGALSPIVEETRQQLSAYENDINWSASPRTASSSSYPEPCADDTAPPSCASPDRTYTLRRDTSSAPQITMSADSLNGSPLKKPLNDCTDATIDDRTYTKHDEDKMSNCERISQVSPFMLSPTTESSAPENSDFVDNGTGGSTTSKTTIPTDAKASKPTETQCLSKATSIDSWCSNDTLYNVEENFDDLAMDPDMPIDFEQKEDEHSESSRTLTHNDDDKEFSHCSTYIIHDSKSEDGDTFSPDSITANDNYTYTKAKTEMAGTTPSVITKSELDSTKNTQTKDLAYGTLMSGLPSYSSCATEAASGCDDFWKFHQPELIRRSPVADEINVTLPQFVQEKDAVATDSPRIVKPCIHKMDSVEISCLQDNLEDQHDKPDNEHPTASSEVKDKASPNSGYKNMVPSLTSTPLNEIPPENESSESIPMELPENPDVSEFSVPNFQTFSQSAEVRPQDVSPRNDDIGGSNTESNRDSFAVNSQTPNYSDFELSAIAKPQDVNLRDKSSQSMESGINNEEFRHFKNSVRQCPQDLSSVIDASSLLLNSERKFSELSLSNSLNLGSEQTSQVGKRIDNYDLIKSLDVSPPNVTNLVESQHVDNIEKRSDFFMHFDEETEQPHSIIITENDVLIKDSPNRTFDSHNEGSRIELNHTYDSHESRSHHDKETPIVDRNTNVKDVVVNGITHDYEDKPSEKPSPKVEDLVAIIDSKSNEQCLEDELVNINPSPITLNLSPTNKIDTNLDVNEENCNGGSEKYAIVQFLNETFEELVESNVDDSDSKELPNDITETSQAQEGTVCTSSSKNEVHDISKENVPDQSDKVAEMKTNGVHEPEDDNMTSVTESFLQNEKNYCQLDAYLPLLSDIRFTGPASEIMSTSFTQDSPTEPTSPENERDGKSDIAAEILKEWDSDSDTHSTNSSSGEFIWKDGDGHETALVSTTHFEHQRGNSDGGSNGPPQADGPPSDGSGDSGSGSEGDEVEFVPSSWDCRAAPSKSSLRSLEQVTQDKKRVVFKRQKYHCVYEYPREAADVEAHSPAYVPDLSTYSDWDPTSAEEAELGYGQLFGAPSPLDLYPLRPALAYDYDEDFFISSSARPFESLGIMSTTSQFFPGMHVKASLVPRDLDDPEDFPPPPSPLPTATFAQTRMPSLDFTTPDSGVEDITPGSITTEEDFKAKKLPEDMASCWRPVDSGSSSESVSPSSPGGEALGGLRHTRDKLKLDLPPSPHIPSPRHNRVFNFVLDKPKRHRITEEKAPEIGTTPLVMSDETPIVATALPVLDCEDLPLPEPTFSTFGKSTPKPEPEQKSIILTDDVQETEEGSEVKVESPKVVEAVKGEGTVLDSGDEDSGIESSSKATLERKTTPNVS